MKIKYLKYGYCFMDSPDLVLEIKGKPYYRFSITWEKEFKAFCIKSPNKRLDYCWKKNEGFYTRRYSYVRPIDKGNKSK